jgi:D-xylonolactonase
MGFTPDLTEMYWTDSTARKIFVFDYNRKTGDLSNRREFYAAPEEAGIPDGMTVDADVCVWSAHWDGHAVHRFLPNGMLIESITFPVAKTSSVTFGGDNLDELYVSTAGGTARKDQPSEESTADGTLYRVRVGIKGQREFRSRIGL